MSKEETYTYYAYNCKCLKFHASSMDNTIDKMISYVQICAASILKFGNISRVRTMYNVHCTLYTYIHTQARTIAHTYIHVGHVQWRRTLPPIPGNWTKISQFTIVNLCDGLRGDTNER